MLARKLVVVALRVALLAPLVGCKEEPGGRTVPGADGPATDGPCAACAADGAAPADAAVTADGEAPFADANAGVPDARPPGSDSGGGAGTGYFPPQSVWYTDHSNAPVHPSSAAIIAWLDGAGGWGNGKLQIDFSIEVLEADASTPLMPFTPTGDFWSPDCDAVPVPVPPGGAIEGEAGYACASDGDCHLIVVHRPTSRLYEMWRANIQGGAFFGGCLAVWDMTRVYGPKGRGEGCTSADAAGFPIAPLLFSAAEVQAGAIDHAIRFILPNARIRANVYVRPATHSTQATSGGPDAPPYGVHLRLKASTSIGALTPGAQVVAKALMKHGMFLADGGTVALTAQSDRFTAAKWAGLLGPHDLTSLKVTDFEVVDHGADIDWSGDCAREP